MASERFGWGLLGCLLIACGSTSGGGTAGASRPVSSVFATFNVHYPTGFGHRITVHCGDLPGLDWTKPIQATWTTDDVWVATVPAGGTVHCKPLYDDATWAAGPNWSLAGNQIVEAWPHFFHDTGRVDVISNWHSSTLNDDRAIRIYYPPSYDENWRQSYPVVYMHDGQNLFDDGTAAFGVSWNVGGTMDEGARSATIQEAIIVGVDNDANRIPEYTPVADPQYGGGNGDAYLTFLINELKPQMDLQLRTLPDAAHTALVGSSLGGLISIYAGLHRPDVYGLIGALSPSTWWDNTSILGQSQATQGPFPLRVYLDSGDSGNSNDDEANTQSLAQVWQGKPNVVVDYWVQAGASHNETFWRQRLPRTLAFLLGAGR